MPPQLSFLLPLYLQPQVLSPVTTVRLDPACCPHDQLATFHQPAGKQTSGWILFLSSLPLPPLIFLRGTIIYTYVILVLYGLKMTHYRGGVSCALHRTASRKPLPACVCAPPAAQPPPRAHTTTSVVMGVLVADTISTTTTSLDSQLHP